MPKDRWFEDIIKNQYDDEEDCDYDEEMEAESAEEEDLDPDDKDGTLYKHMHQTEVPELPQITAIPDEELKPS